MPPLADNIDNSSKKELLAKNSLPGDNNMPPPESRLNRLHVELIILLPVSGDANSIRYHYSNRLWLEYTQYSLNDIAEINEHFFETVICRDDQFIVSKTIRDLACGGPDKKITTTFTLHCKDGSELTALWTCKVAYWYCAGKPNLISCCGCILDENFRDHRQMQVYLNRIAHSKKIKLAKALDDEYLKLLKLIHQNTPNTEIAKIMNWSVSKVKDRKSRLVAKLEFASYADLVEFTFQSSLFC
jgi:hypothetical protein